MFCNQLAGSLRRPFPQIGGPFVCYFAEDGAGGGSGDVPPAKPPEPPAGDAPSGWADEKQGLINESKKYRARAQQAEATVGQLQEQALSEEDREQFNQLKADDEKRQQDDLKAQGEYDKLLAQKQEKFDEALGAKQQELDSFRGAFQQVAVTDRLKGLLAGKGVTRVSEAAFLLQGQFPKRAVADLVDGNPVIRVVDRQGQLVTDADCEPGQSIGVDALVNEFVASEAGQIFLPPSGDSGSGAHAGTPGDATMAELDADPAKTAAFIQKHGGDAYMKLAQGDRLRKRQEAAGK